MHVMVPIKKPPKRNFVPSNSFEEENTKENNIPIAILAANKKLNFKRVFRKLFCNSGNVILCASFKSICFLIKANQPFKQSFLISLIEL